MKYNIYQYVENFRGDCTNVCRLFSTLAPFNTVGRPENFRSATIAVSRKLDITRNTVDLYGTWDFGEGTCNIIVAFKEGWRFKIVFNSANSLAMWRRHGGRRKVLKRLLRWRQVTWPAPAITQFLHVHTNIFINQFNFTPFIPSKYYQTSISVTFRSPCIKVSLLSRLWVILTLWSWKWTFK